MYILDTDTIIPFDEAAARRFDELGSQRSLRKIGRADLRITSIALSRRAMLVMCNLKHLHKVPALRLENWVD